MNRFLIILFGLLIIPLFSHAHGDRIELNMSGVVNDARTNEPVSGALISIEKNGEMIYSVRTARDGSFLIRFEDPVGRHDQWKVKVGKKGYESYSFPPLNTPKQEDLAIELSPKSPIPILKPVNKASPLIAI